MNSFALLTKANNTDGPCGILRCGPTLSKARFVDKYCVDLQYEDVKAVVQRINELGVQELWISTSPLWLRPQGGSKLKMYSPNGLMQVVGHTPMQAIKQERCFISCDVFSTYRDGSRYGSNQFLLVDSVEKSWKGVKGDD